MDGAKRKWDELQAGAPEAPGPVAQKGRAGIGSVGVTGIGHPAYGGSFPEPPPAPEPAVEAAAAGGAGDGGNGGVGGARELTEEDVKRLQANAAAVVARMNEVRGWGGVRRAARAGGARW